VASVPIPFLSINVISSASCKYCGGEVLPSSTRSEEGLNFPP